MDDFERGIIVRTIEASDPSRFRKWMPIIGTVICLGLTLARIYIMYIGDPDFFLPIAIVLVIVLSIVYTFVFFALRSIAGRGLHPIQIYHSGVQFPSFAFNRLLRNDGFINKADIEKISIYNNTQSIPKNKGGDQYCTFTIHGKNKKNYYSGPRLKTDVQPTLDWIEKEWGAKVEEIIYDPRTKRMVPVNSTQTKETQTYARKIPVYSTAPLPVEYEHPQASAAPPMEFCTSCGAGMLRGSRFCPSCGTHVDGVMPIQGIAQQYPSPNYQIPYGQSPVAVPFYERKNPRVAMGLALLGLVGLMGVGHMYARRWVKGIGLLLIGGFFAAVGLVGVMISAVEFSSSPEIAIGFFAISNFPFFLILGWSILDAPKAAKRYNAGVK